MEPVKGVKVCCVALICMAAALWNRTKIKRVRASYAYRYTIPPYVKDMRNFSYLYFVIILYQKFFGKSNFLYFFPTLVGFYYSF